MTNKKDLGLDVVYTIQIFVNSFKFGSHHLFFYYVIIV